MQSAQISGREASSPMKPKLSKSKVILGIQCPKALYLSTHHPELSSETSDSQQMIFDQGHAVGILAQTRFPGGVLIDAPYDKSKLAIEQTQAAISDGAKSVFEATLSHEDVLVKVDVLTRKGPNHAWEIVEVKSSTEVKDVHVSDAAVQLWVCKGAGLKMKSASIMTINNQCTFPDLSNLFSLSDVTEATDQLVANMPKTVSAFKKMLSAEKPPKKEIGPHCDDPYECTFKAHCWSERKIPEVSVFDIPRLSGQKKWERYRSGKVSLESLNPGDFNETQARMIECTVKKKRFTNAKGISQAMADWRYPYSFLDFETIGYAIPRYNGQRPYQQLPFQFSCHIRRGPTENLVHCEYLHTTDSDPRVAISKALVDLIPDRGSVIAYNMGFERGVLMALAEQFPEYSQKLIDISERLVDPLPIFRAHVYDPGFKGSYSIKNVAPALLGDSASYEEMDVGDGTAAQSAYIEMINPATDPSRKEKLRQGLIAYCTKDTLGMVELVDWLLCQTELNNPKRKGK
jgi:Domain of unknown function(DUF2779)/Domain of unknown function DUF83